MCELSCMAGLHGSAQVGKIARSEGILSMWRTGVVPNMNRVPWRHDFLKRAYWLPTLPCTTVGSRRRKATIITVGQLAAYDTCKEVFVDACPDEQIC